MRRPKAQPITTSPVQAKRDASAQHVGTQNLIPGQGIQAALAKHYTREQSEAQFTLVEQALIQGLSEREIRKALALKGHPVGLGRVRTLKARVHEAMKLEGERSRPMTREKQLRRLYAELAEARGKVDAKGVYITKPHWSAVTRLEQLIASVEGNFEAIKIDVDVVHREALTNVLTSITPEQAAQMTASYDKLSELAMHAAHALGQKMPQLLPAPQNDAITVFTQGSSSAAE